MALQLSKDLGLLIMRVYKPTRVSKICKFFLSSDTSVEIKVNTLDEIFLRDLFIIGLRFFKASRNLEFGTHSLKSLP